MTAPAGPRAAELTPALGKDLLGSVGAFIFDCDGVIWRGDSVLEGVPETLAALRALGKKLVFVTNNSTKSRAGYMKKFTGLGLDVRAEEIYSSSYAAAAYLKAKNFPKDKKVYVVGEVGIMEELELAGINRFGGPEDTGKKIELRPGMRLDQDPDVGAVVVGLDREVNYRKIQYATLCIRENADCEFIATNTDAVTHLTDAQEWAGGGSTVGAIQGSTQTEPTVVGKPSSFMLEDVAAKFGLDKSQICMIGDRLDTDILFGKNGGLRTMLVLTGVTTEARLLDESNNIQPDLYTAGLKDLLPAAQALAQ
jgi:phosphoglycolate phosphatase